MLTIHDRQMIFSYLKAYLFCLVSLILLGAGIYHSQRERIHWILIHRPAPPAIKVAAPVRVY